MVPFLGILCVQILMFATLNSVTKISEISYSDSNEDEPSGTEIMLGEIF